MTTSIACLHWGEPGRAILWHSLEDRDVGEGGGIVTLSRGSGRGEGEGRCGEDEEEAEEEVKQESLWHSLVGGRTRGGGGRRVG